MSPLASGWVVETLRDQHRCSAKSGPGLPSLVPEPEHGYRLFQRNHIHSERVSQIRSDLTQHLERFAYLYRRAKRIKSQGLTQQVDAIHVHPRRAASTQI